MVEDFMETPLHPSDFVCDPLHLHINKGDKFEINA